MFFMTLFYFSAGICEIHFNVEDIIEKGKMKYLKQGAVPHHFLPKQTPLTSTTERRVLVKVMPETNVQRYKSVKQIEKAYHLLSESIKGLAIIHIHL